MNIVVCDDESCYRTAVHDSVKRWANLRILQGEIIVRCFSSSEALLEAWENGWTIDVAFLDIQIPGEMSGLQLAKALRDADSQTTIIFFTNYSEYACDGYCVNALRYLQKPVSDKQIFECLNIAYNQWNFAHEQSIFIDAKNQKFILPFRNILYIEAHAHYLNIYRINKPLMQIRCRILDILEKLPAEMFIQCHRGFIVNILYARQITKNRITLAGEHVIPIGPKYVSGVFEKFKQYYQGMSL